MDHTESYSDITDHSYESADMKEAMIDSRADDIESEYMNGEMDRALVDDYLDSDEFIEAQLEAARELFKRPSLLRRILSEESVQAIEEGYKARFREIAEEEMK